MRQPDSYGVAPEGISNGSTVSCAITRTRTTVPFAAFFTETTSPRRPDCIASAATCTSTPALRATMVTFELRFTSNGSLSQRRSTSCPARRARRLDLPATSAMFAMAPGVAVTSRRSSVNAAASMSSPAFTFCVETTTSAAMVARTMTSRFSPLHVTANRMRAGCRTSIVSIGASPGHPPRFAVGSFSLSCGFVQPMESAYRVRCSRAIRSTALSIAVAADAPDAGSNSKSSNE